MPRVPSNIGIVQTLVDRNRAFASNFPARSLQMMPKLGTLVLTCTHPRVDVSHTPISNHQASLREDVDRLRDAEQISNDLVVSAFIYDLQDGSLGEVIAPAPLSAIQGKGGRSS